MQKGRLLCRWKEGLGDWQELQIGVLDVSGTVLLHDQLSYRSNPSDNTYICAKPVHQIADRAKA